jgi:15-hydroxyprostaglandin dehydrogenase (NAD)
VFANAGIVDRQSFYAVQESNSNGLPPPLNMDVLRVDLDAVISTCYLAQHFYRKNSPVGGSIIITASIGSFYPTADLPLYSAAKHACLGFMRSIAGRLMKENIRVNCICPSSVKTALLNKDAWDAFPPELDTPLTKIVEVVNLVLADVAMHGHAIEIMMQDHQSRGMA